MPNRDKTGPEGKGPQTGRGFGNCKGNSSNSRFPRMRRFRNRRNFNHSNEAD